MKASRFIQSEEIIKLTINLERFNTQFNLDFNSRAKRDFKFCCADNMSDCKVYIGHLSGRTRERDILDAFDKFGKIASYDHN
jgi:hypothetical protein